MTDARIRVTEDKGVYSIEEFSLESGLSLDVTNGRRNDLIDQYTSISAAYALVKANIDAYNATLGYSPGDYTKK